MTQRPLGSRTIDLLPVLRDVLAAHRADGRTSDDLVFSTSSGGPLDAANVRNKALAPSVKRASTALTATGAAPLPDGLSPHKLCHTYASLLVALGVDPGACMDQLGHADPGFTLKVYRHAMRRDPESKQALRQLVEGVSMGANGCENADDADPGLAAGGAEAAKTRD